MAVKIKVNGDSAWEATGEDAKRVSFRVIDGEQGGKGEVGAAFIDDDTELEIIVEDEAYSQVEGDVVT